MTNYNIKNQEIYIIRGAGKGRVSRPPIFAMFVYLVGAKLDENHAGEGGRLKIQF